MMRRLLGIVWTDFRTNQSIRLELKVPTSLSAVVKSRILSYFGHISRRGNDSVERLMVQGTVDGNRARGRSPTRWADQVKNMLANPLHVCTRKAAAREEWRRLVRRIEGKQ